MGLDAVYGNLFGKKNPDELSDFLKKVYIFEQLSKSDLKILEKLLHRRTYQPEEAVFIEGETGVGMYIVLEGQVRICIKTFDGTVNNLALLDPGDFFGEMAVLDEVPRSATAIAATPCTLLGFFYPDLQSLIEQKPRLGSSILLALSKVVAERLRYMNKEYQRLAHEIRCRNLDIEL